MGNYYCGGTNNQTVKVWFFYVYAKFILLTGKKATNYGNTMKKVLQIGY